MISRHRLFTLLTATLAFVLASGSRLLAQDPFLEKPYLQLGNNPKLAAKESLMLLWHTGEQPADWKVEVKTSKDTKWRAVEHIGSTVVSAPAAPAIKAGQGGAKKDMPAVPAIEPHLVYRAHLSGLIPGEPFQYRVLKAGQPVFEATGHPRKAANQPFRFVLFGDCGQGTPEENAIAFQAYQAKPDFVFIPGDIVYGSGRISEYRTRFFPTYNAEQPSIEAGAPLLRSVPFIAMPGNHDSDLNHFLRYPDALAYFLYWDQPLNGPVAKAGDKMTAHVLTGNEEAQPIFRKGAGDRYPRMANYSFDYGNTHWTVLDANRYMDWSNESLRQWVIDDLKSAANATFRIVSFHQPGFNSSKNHFAEQYMRQLAPIFEAGKVDVVFSGHVHNYQRSYPLTFVPKAQPDGKMITARGEMDGEWTLDKTFNDGSSAKPKGVIYIVSGAGGAGLYNPEQQDDPASWQGFTHKFISKVHSLSVVEVNGKTLKLKQIDTAGKEVDSFQIKK